MSRKHTLQLHDLAFLSIRTLIGWDDIESYTTFPGGPTLKGLAGGKGFSASYEDRGAFGGVYWYDTFEAYSGGDPLNGLALEYVDRQNYLGVIASDNFDSYNNADPLIGLTGGVGWTSSYQHA